MENNLGRELKMSRTAGLVRLLISLVVVVRLCQSSLIEGIFLVCCLTYGRLKFDLLTGRG